MEKQIAEQEQKSCRAFLSTLLLGTSAICIRPFYLSMWQSLNFSVYGYMYVSNIFFLSLCLNLCIERVAKKHVPSYWSVISSVSLGYLKVQQKVLWLLHGTCNFKPLISGQYYKHIMKQAVALNHLVPCRCCAELPLATSRKPAKVKVPNTATIPLWYEMVKFSSPFFFVFCSHSYGIKPRARSIIHTPCWNPSPWDVYSQNLCINKSSNL